MEGVCLAAWEHPKLFPLNTEISKLSLFEADSMPPLASDESCPLILFLFHPMSRGSCVWLDPLNR